MADSSNAAQSAPCGMYPHRSKGGQIPKAATRWQITRFRNILRLISPEIFINSFDSFPHPSFSKADYHLLMLTIFVYFLLFWHNYSFSPLFIV